MALKTSTGLRNGMLTTGSLASLINGSVIKIYSGSVPDTADATINYDNVLLNVISVNNTGSGISFVQSGSDGILQKNQTEVWSGLNLDSGKATYFRIVDTSDNGSSSDKTSIRLQGTIALTGANINMDPDLIAGAIQAIDYMAIGLPTL